MSERAGAHPILILLLAAVGFLPWPRGVEAAELIVDNLDAGFTTTGGGWGASANAGFWGSNSLVKLMGNGSARATWSTPIAAPGEYEVFAWWVAAGNRAQNAVYTVNHANGASSVTVNQTANGSRWNSLGRFTFGSTASVFTTDGFTLGEYLSADAVRWVATGNAGAEPCQDPIPAPPLVNASGACSRCGGRLLAGAIEPSPASRYYIHSDLPEVLRTTGVLYTTAPVIPESPTGPIPLNLRTQVNNGFTTLDDDFEFFLFHISSPGDGSQVRRMTIYVRNDGTGPVTIFPRQIMITDGVIGDVHEMESNLGRRVLDEDWDTPIASVTLQPGEGNVIAYSKQFPGFPNGPDRSANVNCFARIHASVTNADGVNHPTNLTAYVVAINAANISQNRSRAEALLTTGAESGDSVSLLVPPGGCALSRACGVVETFVWRSEVVDIDIASLPAGGYQFQMGLPRVQTGPCPSLRQTRDMVLHPGYAPPDTVGNYMTDYRVHFRLVNRDPSAPRAFDVRFGKTDADVGLAWKAAVSRDGLSDGELDAIPAQTGWAGPRQATLSRSFLPERGTQTTIMPCDSKRFDLRFIVLGNASLPFNLSVEPAADVTIPAGWAVR
jgi:hypothetical protein